MRLRDKFPFDTIFKILDKIVSAAGLIKLFLAIFKKKIELKKLEIHMRMFLMKCLILLLLNLMLKTILYIKLILLLGMLGKKLRKS